MSTPVLAVFRPRDNDIAVFVEDGRHGHRAVAVDIEEARALHGALGNALKCADALAAGEPRKAVNG